MTESKHLLTSTWLLILCFVHIFANQNSDWENAESIYDFNVEDIKGNQVNLGKYRGNVAIIVNVASNCGYTAGHYEELNELFDKYHESHGLEILAFPCNQFGYQEPGDNKDICSFTDSLNVKFDMFSKIDVNGDTAHPLFKYLKHKQHGFLADFIKWNFTKFLINKKGIPVDRQGPTVSPLELEDSLLALFEEDEEPLVRVKSEEL